MKPSIKTLGEILYSPSQYVIPVFQRQYRWESKEWAKLWESLQEIRQPDKTGNHFMGFLVVMPGLPQPGQNTMFHIIDGQQRIATLSILLAAIRNVARQVRQRGRRAQGGASSLQSAGARRMGRSRVAGRPEWRRRSGRGRGGD